jgi:hypothetical protein
MRCNREVEKRSQSVRNMAKKKSDFQLPNWAVPIWESMGSPNLSDVQATLHGDLLERRHGLRKDDIVEILLDARAFTDGADLMLRGVLVSTGKGSLEVLCEDGTRQFISRDVIVKITLIAHTRPAYIDDKELLSFEREDMKRRSKLHEKVEKESTGDTDSHLWG